MKITKGSTPDGVSILSAFLIPTGDKAIMGESGLSFKAEKQIPFLGVLLFFTVNDEVWFDFTEVEYMAVLTVDLPYDRIDWTNMMGRAHRLSEMFTQNDIVQALIDRAHQALAQAGKGE